MELYFDGGSRGNPGHAGSGYVLLDSAKKQFIAAGFVYLGPDETNNVAEYMGLIRGLEHAKRLSLYHHLDVTCLGDSQLVIRQLTGQYQCKAKHLKPLHARATALVRSFPKISLKHVDRADNELADFLSNVAMTRKETAPAMIESIADQPVSLHTLRSHVSDKFDSSHHIAKKARSTVS